MVTYYYEKPGTEDVYIDPHLFFFRMKGRRGVTAVAGRGFISITPRRDEAAGVRKQRTQEKTKTKLDSSSKDGKKDRGKAEGVEWSGVARSRTRESTASSGELTLSRLPPPPLSSLTAAATAAAVTRTNCCLSPCSYRGQRPLAKEEQCFLLKKPAGEAAAREAAVGRRRSKRRNERGERKEYLEGVDGWREMPVCQ